MYIISRIACMNRLVIGLLKHCTVNAIARRKFHGCVLRRVSNQTAPKQFDFFGRCARYEPEFDEFQGRESTASRLDASDGRRTRRRS